MLIVADGVHHNKSGQRSAMDDDWWVSAADEVGELVKAGVLDPADTSAGWSDDEAEEHTSGKGDDIILVFTMCTQFGVERRWC